MAKRSPRIDVRPNQIQDWKEMLWSSVYTRPQRGSTTDIDLMRQIDELYLK